MKIISPQLLFFVLLSTNVFSQQRLDSLKYYYSLQISENERYELISKKVFIPVRAENSDSLLYFTNQIYELAKKTKNLEAISNAEIFMAEAYIEAKNDAVALRHLYTALKGFETIGNKKRIAESCFSISLVYKSMEDHQKSFEFINRSLRLKESVNDKDIYYYASFIYHSNAAFELKDYETGFKSSNLSLDYFIKREYMTTISIGIENNRGFYYHELFKESNVDSIITKLNIQNKEQLLDSALYLYRKVLKIGKKIEDYKHMAYAYFGLGENAYLKKKYIKAIQNYQKSNLISKEKNNNYDLLKRSHYGLYLSYLAIGDYQKALVSYQKFKENEERIQSDDNKRALFKQNLVYEHEKELQKKENEIIKKNNRITEKNRVIIITVVAFLVLLTIVMLLIKRRQLLKDKKSKEKFAHDLLMTQENERKRISEDLHDGLGQSLLFVKNEIVSKNHEKSKKLINSSIEEMRTIARSLYPFQLNNVGIVRAIDNLIVQLNDSTQGIYFFSEIEIKNDVLSDLQQVNTFRIVQECLSNIVKHAKGTSAKVSLTSKNKKVNIRIQDNGVGFNFSKKYSILDTLGLKTIQERVNFLKGTLEIDSKKGQGTSFSIIFSIDT
jgi:signal transduction histidine kinase